MNIFVEQILILVPTVCQQFSRNQEYSCNVIFSYLYNVIICNNLFKKNSEGGFGVISIKLCIVFYLCCGTLPLV